MRHGVVAEIEGAAPGVVDADGVQLWVDRQHPLAQFGGALAHRGLALRHEARAAAKQQAAVGRQPEIMQEVPGVIDHPPAGTEFTRQRLGQGFGRNHVGADRQQLAVQRRRHGAGIAAGRHHDVAGVHNATGGLHLPARTVAHNPLNAGLFVQRRASAAGRSGQPGHVAGRIDAAAHCVDGAAEIGVGADLRAQFRPWHQPDLMRELALQQLGFVKVIRVVTTLRGQRQVPATLEIAVDALRLHDSRHQVDGIDRRLVELARQLAAVARQQRRSAQLVPGEHHAAVARTRTPADGVGFEHGNPDAAPGQRARGAQAGDAGADHDDIDSRWEWRGRGRRHGDRVAPQRSFFHSRHNTNLPAAGTPTPTRRLPRPATRPGRDRPAAGRVSAPAARRTRGTSHRCCGPSRRGIHPGCGRQ